MPLSIVPFQPWLFPDFRKASADRDDLRKMNDSERDSRSSLQWLNSTIAYCLWRAGESWRKSSDRWNHRRWAYLEAVRMLERVKYTGEDNLPNVAITRPVGRVETRSELVDALLAADPLLSDRRLLLHLSRNKLAAMIDSRRVA